MSAEAALEREEGEAPSLWAIVRDGPRQAAQRQALSVIRPRPLPVAPVQLTRIRVHYNYEQGQAQGYLQTELANLARMDDREWASFPADFPQHLEAALNTLGGLQPVEMPALQIIRNRLAEHRAWTPAGAGKRMQAGFGDYATLKARVEHYLDHKGYGGFIEAAKASNFADYSRQHLVRDYLVLRREEPERLAVDPALHERLREVLAWYAPLQAEEVTAIDHKKAMIAGAKLLVEGYMAEFRNLDPAAVNAARAERGAVGGGAGVQAGGGGGGVAPARPPGEARLRAAATATIRGEQLGQRSEIETGILGAIRSGEKADARDLETALTRQRRYAFVAGHLVSETLGGKNADYNLTPMTNAFNTNGGANGIRDPEIEGHNRLRAGHVIRYSTFVTYGNAGHADWWTAVLPTQIVIEISNLQPREGGDRASIADYVDRTDAGANLRRYVLLPFYL